MTPLFSDEPSWEDGREVQERIAARLGRVAEEERKQQRAKRAAARPRGGGGLRQRIRCWMNGLFGRCQE